MGSCISRIGSDGGAGPPPVPSGSCPPHLDFQRVPRSIPSNSSHAVDNAHFSRSSVNLWRSQQLPVLSSRLGRDAGNAADAGCMVLSPSTASILLQRLEFPDLPAVVLRLNRPNVNALNMQPMYQQQQAGSVGQSVLSGQGKNRLLPVWANSQALAHYGLGSASEYSRILQRLSMRDPLLVYVLQKVLQALSSSRHAVSKLHVTADPVAAEPELLGLRITGCWWHDTGLETGGRAAASAAPPTGQRGVSFLVPVAMQEPAVIIQHGVPCNTEEVVPRILRDYFTLSLLPVIVTVSTFGGQVLYQNASSLAYMSDFSSHEALFQPGRQPSSVAGQSELQGMASSSSLPHALPSGRRGNMGPGGHRLAPHAGLNIGSSGPALDNASMATLATVPDELNVLKQLFCMDPEAMEEALEGISHVHHWTGVVQVPNNLKQHMRQVARHRTRTLATQQQLAMAGGHHSVPISTTAAVLPPHPHPWSAASCTVPLVPEGPGQASLMRTLATTLSVGLSQGSRTDAKRGSHGGDPSTEPDLAQFQPVDSQPLHASSSALWLVGSPSHSQLQQLQSPWVQPAQHASSTGAHGHSQHSDQLPHNLVQSPSEMLPAAASHGGKGAGAGLHSAHPTSSTPNMTSARMGEGASSTTLLAPTPSVVLPAPRLHTAHHPPSPTYSQPTILTSSLHSGLEMTEVGIQTHSASQLGLDMGRPWQIEGCTRDSPGSRGTLLPVIVPRFATSLPAVEEADGETRGMMLGSETLGLSMHPNWSPRPEHMLPLDPVQEDGEASLDLDLDLELGDPGQPSIDGPEALMLTSLGPAQPSHASKLATSGGHARSHSLHVMPVSGASSSNPSFSEQQQAPNRSRGATMMSIRTSCDVDPGQREESGHATAPASPRHVQYYLPLATPQTTPYGSPQLQDGHADTAQAGAVPVGLWRRTVSSGCISFPAVQGPKSANSTVGLLTSAATSLQQGIYGNSDSERLRRGSPGLPTPHPTTAHVAVAASASNLSVAAQLSARVSSSGPQWLAGAPGPGSNRMLPGAAKEGAMSAPKGPGAYNLQDSSMRRSFVLPRSVTSVMNLLDKRKSMSLAPGAIPAAPALDPTGTQPNTSDSSTAYSVRPPVSDLPPHPPQRPRLLTLSEDVGSAPVGPAERRIVSAELASSSAPRGQQPRPPPHRTAHQLYTQGPAGTGQHHGLTSTALSPSRYSRKTVAALGCSTTPNGQQVEPQPRQQATGPVLQHQSSLSELFSNVERAPSAVSRDFELLRTVSDQLPQVAGIATQRVGCSSDSGVAVNPCQQPHNPADPDNFTTRISERASFWSIASGQRDSPQPPTAWQPENPPAHRDTLRSPGTSRSYKQLLAAHAPSHSIIPGQRRAAQGSALPGTAPPPQGTQREQQQPQPQLRPVLFKSFSYANPAPNASARSTHRRIRRSLSRSHLSQPPLPQDTPLLSPWLGHSTPHRRATQPPTQTGAWQGQQGTTRPHLDVGGDAAVLNGPPPPPSPEQGLLAEVPFQQQLGEHASQLPCTSSAPTPHADPLMHVGTSSVAVKPCSSNQAAVGPQAAAGGPRQLAAETSISRGVEANAWGASNELGAFAKATDSSTARSQASIAPAPPRAHTKEITGHILPSRSLPSTDTMCPGLPPKTGSAQGNDSSQLAGSSSDDASRMTPACAPPAPAAPAAPAARSKPPTQRLDAYPSAGMLPQAEQGHAGMLDIAEEGDALHPTYRPPSHASLPPQTTLDSLPCWHEITIIPLLDPVLDQHVLLITQTDVTKRVDVERKLAELTTAQMSFLEAMFPRHVIEHMLSAPGMMSTDAGRLANDHEQVTVLFADVVGFTNMSKEVSSAVVMMFLNELYAEFDSIIEEWGLYQLDTMGDCYIAVGGLVQRDSDGFQVLIEQRTLEEAAQDAAAVVGFAKEMLMRARNVHMPHNGQQVTLRIGIHSGKLVSGMLGTRLPKFTLFGDTMNTASRMESTAPPGCIQVSEATHQLLMYAKSMGFASSHLFDEASSRSSNSGEHSLQHGRGSSMAAPMPGVWVETGGVEVKGKGCMDTFVWMPSDHPLRLNDLPTTQTLTPETAPASAPASSPAPAMPSSSASPISQGQPHRLEAGLHPVPLGTKQAVQQAEASLSPQPLSVQPHPPTAGRGTEPSESGIVGQVSAAAVQERQAADSFFAQCALAQDHAVRTSNAPHRRGNPWLTGLAQDSSLAPGFTAGRGSLDMRSTVHRAAPDVATAGNTVLHSRIAHEGVSRQALLDSHGHTSPRVQCPSAMKSASAVVAGAVSAFALLKRPSRNPDHLQTSASTGTVEQEMELRWAPTMVAPKSGDWGSNRGAEAEPQGPETGAAAAPAITVAAAAATSTSTTSKRSQHSWPVHTHDAAASGRAAAVHAVLRPPASTQGPANLPGSLCQATAVMDDRLPSRIVSHLSPQPSHGEEAAGSDPLAGTQPGHQRLGNGDMVGPPSTGGCAAGDDLLSWPERASMSLRLGMAGSQPSCLSIAGEHTDSPQRNSGSLPPVLPNSIPSQLFVTSNSIPEDVAPLNTHPTQHSDTPGNSSGSHNASQAAWPGALVSSRHAMARVATQGQRSTPPSRSTTAALHSARTSYQRTSNSASRTSGASYLSGVSRLTSGSATGSCWGGVQHTEAAVAGGWAVAEDATLGQPYGLGISPNLGTLAEAPAQQGSSLHLPPPWERKSSKLTNTTSLHQLLATSGPNTEEAGSWPGLNPPDNGGRQSDSHSARFTQISFARPSWTKQPSRVLTSDALLPRFAALLNSSGTPESRTTPGCGPSTSAANTSLQLAAAAALASAKGLSGKGDTFGYRRQASGPLPGPSRPSRNSSASHLHLMRQPVLHTGGLYGYACGAATNGRTAQAMLPNLASPVCCEPVYGLADPRLEHLPVDLLPGLPSALLQLATASSRPGSSQCMAGSLANDSNQQLASLLQPATHYHSSSEANASAGHLAFPEPCVPNPLTTGAAQMPPGGATGLAPNVPRLAGLSHPTHNAALGSWPYSDQVHLQHGSQAGAWHEQQQQGQQHQGLHSRLQARAWAPTSALQPTADPQHLSPHNCLARYPLQPLQPLPAPLPHPAMLTQQMEYLQLMMHQPQAPPVGYAERRLSKSSITSGQHQRSSRSSAELPRHLHAQRSLGHTQQPSILPAASGSVHAFLGSCSPCSAGSSAMKLGSDPSTGHATSSRARRSSFMVLSSLGAALGALGPNP